MKPHAHKADRCRRFLVLSCIVIFLAHPWTCLAVRPDKQRDVSSARGHLDVWLHRTNSVTAIRTNRGDNYVSVTTLATKQYTVTGLKAPTNLTHRTLRALVDSRSTICEIVETNNESSATYTPVP